MYIKCLLNKIYYHIWINNKYKAIWKAVCLTEENHNMFYKVTHNICCLTGSNEMRRAHSLVFMISVLSRTKTA